MSEQKVPQSKGTCQYCKAEMHADAIKCPSCGEYVPEIQKASNLRLQLNLYGIPVIVLLFVRAQSLSFDMSSMMRDPLMILGAIVAIVVIILTEKQGKKVRAMKKGKYW